MSIGNSPGPLAEDATDRMDEKSWRNNADGEEKELTKDFFPDGNRPEELLNMIQLGVEPLILHFRVGHRYLARYR